MDNIGADALSKELTDSVIPKTTQVFGTPVKRTVGRAFRNLLGVFSSVFLVLFSLLSLVADSIIGAGFVLLSLLALITEILVYIKSKSKNLETGLGICALSLFTILTGLVLFSFSAISFFEISLPFSTLIAQQIPKLFGVEISVHHPILQVIFAVFAAVLILNGICFANIKRSVSRNMPNCRFCALALLFDLLVLLASAWLIYNILAAYFGIFHINLLVISSSTLLSTVLCAVFAVLLFTVTLLGALRLLNTKRKLNALKRLYKK